MTKQWIKYWIIATPFIAIFGLLLIVERPLAWFAKFFEWTHDKVEDGATFIWNPFRNYFAILKVEARKGNKSEASHD